MSSLVFFYLQAILVCDTAVRRWFNTLGEGFNLNTERVTSLLDAQYSIERYGASSALEAMQYRLPKYEDA